jgi:predicted negative regulator of RcsB-dependent stress response
MKKLLVFLIVVGLIGGGVYFGYTRYFSRTPRSACRKLAELCGQRAEDQHKRCEDAIQRMEQVSGKESVQKSVTCILEADSCAKGMGCMVGMGVGALGEFLEGLKRSVGGK